MARGHAEALLPMAEAVMEGYGYDTLDAVAVTVGPGAYTGFASLPETDRTKTTLFLGNHRIAQEAGSIEFGAFYRRLEDDYDFDRRTTEAGQPGALDHETRVYGVGVEGLRRGARLEWRYAGQLTSDELVYSTDLTESDFTNRDYLSASVAPTLRLDGGEGREIALQFGGTFDWSSRDGGHFSPVLAATMRSDAEAIANAEGADAILGWCSAGVLEAAEDIVWVQVFSAGVERCLAAFYYAQQEKRERDFLLHAGEAIWARGVDVATDAGMRKVTGRCGLFWPDVLAAMEDDSWREKVEDNRAAMFDAGCWGVPTLRLGDFTTWGQDRLWLLARHLEEHCDAGEGILV